MTVAPVVLAGTPARPGRFLCRVALGERCRLALPRTPAVLQQLLQLGDARVTGSERLGQFGDPRFEADDRCGQLGDRASITTWKQIARRNSQRYARASARWWTPLSQYVRSSTIGSYSILDQPPSFDGSTSDDPRSDPKNKLGRRVVYSSADSL